MISFSAYELNLPVVYGLMRLFGQHESEGLFVKLLEESVPG
jgi:hypothetical protein